MTTASLLMNATIDRAAQGMTEHHSFSNRNVDSECDISDDEREEREERVRSTQAVMSLVCESIMRGTGALGIPSDTTTHPPPPPLDPLVEVVADEIEEDIEDEEEEQVEEDEEEEEREEKEEEEGRVTSCRNCKMAVTVSAKSSSCDVTI